MDFQIYQNTTKILEDNACPDSTLYHYTDWTGLKGILESRKIYLTHYQFLEDTSEVSYAFNELKRYILDNTNGDLKLFFSDVLYDFENHLQKNVDFFTASFCKQQDYLPAWKDYAKDATGYAIGFKKEFFNGKNIVPDRTDLNFSRGKIHYGIEKLKATLDALISLVHKDLSQNNGFENSNKGKISRNRIAKYFCASLFPFLTSIKEQYFENEREHRIYAFMQKKCEEQKFYSNIVKNINEKSIPKVYFQFELCNIIEIWIGSNSSFSIAKSKVEDLFCFLGTLGHDTINIEIKKSNAPYKNMTEIL